ncbi:MAG: hypothetical protein WKF97_10530 [Chitinophagaceae bacterium]
MTSFAGFKGSASFLEALEDGGVTGMEDFVSTCFASSFLFEDFIGSGFFITNFSKAGFALAGSGLSNLLTASIVFLIPGGLRIGDPGLDGFLVRAGEDPFLEPGLTAFLTGAIFFKPSTFLAELLVATFFFVAIQLSFFCNSNF